MCNFLWNLNSRINYVYIQCLEKYNVKTFSVRPELRGVAGPEVLVGEEDGEEGSSGHCLQEDSARSLRSKQLRNGSRKRSLLRRSQVKRIQKCN
jgi:hypothetical protein